MNVRIYPLTLFRHCALLLPLLLIALALPGCSIPGKERREADNVYIITGGLPEAESPKGNDHPPCRTLLITSPGSAPGYATSAMVYIRQPFLLEHYAFHRWADTPARMIHPLLRRALDQSGLFEFVVNAPASVDADLRLDTEVLNLHREIMEGRSSVELAVQVRLIHGDEVLATRRFSFEEPTEELTPYSGVKAANVVVGRLLDATVAMVRETVRHHPQQCR